MSRISKITGGTVLDSRGAETLTCTLTLESGVEVYASVPQGKSTGSHEAISISVPEALHVLEHVISPRIMGMMSDAQYDIDALLCELGGEQKKDIGGNTALVVSIAVARAHAQEIGVPLWSYLRTISHIPDFPSPFPRPFVNCVNGGAHTGNTALFQEYIVVPQENSMDASLTTAERILKVLGEKIEIEYPGTLRGDEGGFALQIQDAVRPFELLREIDDTVVFALDAAATESAYTDEERTRIFTEMGTRFPLRFLEDPYGEESFALFSQLSKNIPQVVIVGDDLTTTNGVRIERAHVEQSITGIIIKPNQIGTVSEALDAVRKAREYGWSVIASHRSGETDDAFIADFAYGVGADGIKIGAPVQHERKAKYDRLRAIEKEITK